MIASSISISKRMMNDAANETMCIFISLQWMSFASSSAFFCTGLMFGFIYVGILSCMSWEIPLFRSTSTFVQVFFIFFFGLFLFLHSPFARASTKVTFLCVFNKFIHLVEINIWLDIERTFDSCYQLWNNIQKKWKTERFCKHF